MSAIFNRSLFSFSRFLRSASLSLFLLDALELAFDLVAFDANFFALEEAADDRFCDRLRDGEELLLDFFVAMQRSLAQPVLRLVSQSKLPATQKLKTVAL